MKRPEFWLCLHAPMSSKLYLVEPVPEGSSPHHAPCPLCKGRHWLYVCKELKQWFVNCPQAPKDAPLVKLEKVR